MDRFSHRSRIPVTAEQAFHWHARPATLERLLPPWESAHIEEQAALAEGAEVTLRLGGGMRWVVRYENVKPPHEFQVVQVRGPFSSWRHTHRFQPLEQDETMLEDEIEYALPAGRLGAQLADNFNGLLERLFRFRHERTCFDLMRHDTYSDTGPLRVAITGSSGLVGSNLAAFLRSGGHEVIPVIRSRDAIDSQSLFWDPASGEIDAQGFSGLDAVVHLAGENLFALRWTEEKKRKIRESRVQGTSLLATTLAKLDDPPKALLSASGVNYYGDRGNTVMTEDSPAGEGFLAEVCKEWEAATRPAIDAGIRVVRMRSGVVMSGAGGMLGTLLPAFKMGLGTVMGSGEQYISWIAMDDLLGAIQLCLMRPDISGPVNTVAPEPITNAEFTKILGDVLHRPTPMRIPEAFVKTGLGDMGRELVLGSARVEPKVLARSGFEYFFADLEDALRFELGRTTESGDMEAASA